MGALEEWRQEDQGHLCYTENLGSSHLKTSKPNKKNPVERQSALMLVSATAKGGVRRQMNGV